MVSSLAINAAGPTSSGGQAGAAPMLERVGYERQLSCQIWSLDGRLVARSSGAPDDSLGDEGDGFSDRQVSGEPWRVYAVSDQSKGIRVLVGDRLGLREKLVSDLIRGLLWPTIFIVPLLGLLIWTSLGRGLRPLQLMAVDLKYRSVDDIGPVNFAPYAARDTPPRHGVKQPVCQARSGASARTRASPPSPRTSCGRPWPVSKPRPRSLSPRPTRRQGRARFVRLLLRSIGPRGSFASCSRWPGLMPNQRST